MAISKINFTVTDGNLFSAIAGEDHVSALVFDVTESPVTGNTIAADGEVHQIFSIKEAEALGIDGIVDPANPTGDEYENGVVHKHISDFFTINPNGELFVGLADCSSDFSHISKTQTVAQSRIRQFGVYTDQELFSGTTSYTLASYVAAIDTIAEADADNNKPYSVIICGNSATVGGGATDVEIGKIPTAISSLNRVSLCLGQDNSELVRAIQTANSKALVGCVGTLIGAVSLASVHESIGWTSKFNVSSAIGTIAFGFGGVVADINDNTPEGTLNDQQLNVLDDYGYIFPLRYPDLAAVYISSNKTLTNGDYKTIARNRAIDKSRRNVRLALLPTIQQPLYVDAETGQLSAGTISVFRSIVQTQLAALEANGEISGSSIIIDPTQNVLSNDGVKIQYRIVPVLENKQVEVEIGLSIQV